MNIFLVITSIIAAIRAVWTRGSPFAAATPLFQTNEEGKYIIKSEGVRLAFTNNGGALTNLWINDTNGNEIDIVMGFDSAENYLRYPGNPFLNGVIGRYVGVISSAEFEFDGLIHQVHSNSRQNGDKRDTPKMWNGGDKGWGRTILDIGSHTENSITFVLFDRGWNGFPGTAAACLTHTVTPYEWRISFGVTPTRKTTPLNLSQQVFWNLNGFARSSSNGTVAGHRLRLPFSGLRIDVDQDGVPTGDLKANKRGSAYDFWVEEGKMLGWGLAQLRNPNVEVCGGSTVKGRCDSYDQTFLLDRPQPWKKDDHPVATLSSEHSGISVDLYTDQEALHVLTWDSEQGVIPFKRGQGKGEVPNFGAISMEMQDWPDAVNKPEWQRERRIFWGTDRLYTTFSSFKFRVDRSKEENVASS